MVELKEKRLRKSLSEAKNGWQGQKDLNPRHAVLEATPIHSKTLINRRFFMLKKHLNQILNQITYKK